MCDMLTPFDYDIWRGETAADRSSHATVEQRAAPKSATSSDLSAAAAAFWNAAELLHFAA
jgi:hypothetical protein